LNDLCEQTESRIKSLETYEPKNTQEKKEHKTLVLKYKSNFEKLLGSLETNVTKNNNRLAFDDLDNEIFKQRNEHIKLLQQKMIVVGEIMKDCADTVAKQGEDMDRIDLNVSDTKINTRKAVEELEITDQTQRRKKKCCWLLVFVSAGFLIAMIIVVVILTKK
jgi:vacuolar-type H+-ATPase subunit I/STV1